MLNKDLHADRNDLSPILILFKPKIRTSSMSSGLVLDTYDSIREAESETFPIAPPTQPTESFNPSKEPRPRSSKSLGRIKKPKKPERESLYYVDNGDKIDDLGIRSNLSSLPTVLGWSLSDGGRGYLNCWLVKPGLALYN